jgi:hypothetical protein
MSLLDFSVNVFFPAADPGFDLASKEMSTRNILGVKGGWCARLTTSPPSVSQFLRKYGSIDV